MNRQPPPMQSPPRPAYPQQAYNPGPTRQSPPSQPQTTTSPTQPVLNSQRDPRLDQSQLPYTLQRRPELPQLQRQPSRPDQPPFDPQQRQFDPRQQQQLQRQPSRPDQQPQLQRQPSRPDQQPQLQRQPSRPDQPPQLQYNNPMAAADNNYVYKEVPVNPAASDPIRPVLPALMRTPSAPSSSSSSPSAYSESQYSQSTMFPRPYDSGMVIRGNSDDELDKSDVFWRRFNASAAHAERASRPDAEKSSWLEKTEGKSSRHSRTLWIVGLVFVLLAAGGIGIGIFFSFHNTSNTTRPNTLGGAENVAGAQAATIALGATAAAAGTDAGQTASGTALHVTPTNTVA